MEYIPAKTIVTNAKDSQWFGIDYNMNIYKGCCHGCIYCDSRSACYRIENFDQVRAKENALRIIRDDLNRKVKQGVVGTGAMSDPYNPFEKELKLTRNALELINAYEFGAAIATKSNLVTRDIDILKDIKKHSPVLVKLSITAYEDKLSKIVEPNVSPSSERFDTIEKLTNAGIFAGVLMMPILPFIEDNEDNILQIIHRAKESGAKFIYPAFGVTMRQRQREYFYEKLEQHFPELKKKYQSRYGDTRYSCTSPKAKKLWGIFNEECDRIGLYYKMKDIIWAYKLGYKKRQMSLF
ncbi:SPL family radical SAM protein [Desulfuribacillus alkaliarsenatis]|uniref:Radical SAM protein n=1 Tax=Desulfuribacillus alkaliarsenatis TaxID=766136 RepID=A0A1E5G1Y1_9FIRM|nr:radical SAM protein [Desulfuribacillus alkaliarsenatis]OEF96989.1 radical SAM protein [Desulfuribacillus alkaliarsenatis]